jgi:uncharacterized protein with PhoU and TrkA domain
MAKALKKRVQRLEAQVETLTKKVQALGRTAARKISKPRSKVAGGSVARKVKSAAVKPSTPTTPSESAPQSGGA